tara:strand:+ start:357 stop:737 length:381 start_codon:yes stop_codon:yes gene_type:complete
MRCIPTRPDKNHPDEEHWQVVRKAALARDGRKCRICGSSKALNVHHIHYENWGKEKLQDLTTLCREHHKMITLKNRELRKRKFSNPSKRLPHKEIPKCAKCNQNEAIESQDEDGDYYCLYCHEFYK